MRSDHLHQKLALVQQLKTLARQHEQALEAFERKVQEKLQEGSLAPSAGGKRAGPPTIAEGPEAKRQRQLLERQSRKNELWGEVIKTVEKIRKNAKSEPFRQPVDIIRLKIPDYFNIIKKPMDLGTILKKLRSKPMGYTCPSEVADDVRQIWLNCRTYNGPTHPVALAANTCSEAFEKAWGQANIEYRWTTEQMREAREEQAFAERGGGEAVADDNIVNQLRYKRNMLGDLIAAKDVQDNLPPGSLGDLAPDRDMTFEEKRKLSAHMASLPGEKLVAVLDIIQEAENVETDGDGEIEVDIDALHNNTLWKLKAYVDGVLTATTGPPPKKSANRPAPLKQAPAGAAGGMPPPGPSHVQAGLVQQQLTPEQPSQPPPVAAGGMPPPPQQPPQTQPPHPMPPPGNQQPPAAPQSPGHSGGVSAQEVVGSTAGGPGGARSHQLTYDMGTVAQSGTTRPSNFVKDNKRQPTPTGEGMAAAAAAAPAAAAAGQQPAGDAAQTDKETEAWLEATGLGGQGGADQQPDDPASGDDAAAAAADAAEAAPADATQPPADAAEAAPAANGEGAAAEADAAEAASGDAAAADGDGDGEDAAEEGIAAPAAAAAAGDGSGAAASGAGGDVDMWDKFAEQAAQEEEQLAKKQEDEQRRLEEAEALKRQAEQAKVDQEEGERLKRKHVLEASVGGAGGAAASDAAVHTDLQRLMKAGGEAAVGAGSPDPKSPPPPPSNDAGPPVDQGVDGMEVDTESHDKQPQPDESEVEEAEDGGGFD